MSDMNTQSVPGQQMPNQKKSSMMGAAVVGGLLVLAVIVAVVAVLAGGNSGKVQDEMIQSFVSEAKENLDLPMAVDSSTTLVDLVAEGDAVRYEYEIAADLDRTGFSNEFLKEFLLPTVCANPDAPVLFDAGIELKYSYAVADSDESYLVVINEEDCE